MSYNNDIGNKGAQHFLLDMRKDQANWNLCNYLNIENIFSNQMFSVGHPNVNICPLIQNSNKEGYSMGAPLRKMSATEKKNQLTKNFTEIFLWF